MRDAKAVLEELLAGREDRDERVAECLDMLHSETCSTAKDIAYGVILFLAETGVATKRLRKGDVYHSFMREANPKISYSNMSHYTCEAINAWEKQRAEAERRARAEEARQAREQAAKRAEKEMKRADVTAGWSREKVEQAKPEVKRTGEDDADAAADGRAGGVQGRKALLITSENPMVLDMVRVYLSQMIGDVNIHYRVVVEPALRDYDMESYTDNLDKHTDKSHDLCDLLFAISPSERRFLPRRRARGGAAGAWGTGGAARLAA